MKFIPFSVKVFTVILFFVFVFLNRDFLIDFIAFHSKNLFAAIKTEIISAPNILFWERRAEEQVIEEEALLIGVLNPLNETFPINQPPQEIENINAVNILEIPKINVNVRIWPIPNKDRALIYDKLQEGVILFPGSQTPGKGFSIILGHSSQEPWRAGPYSSIFARLNNLNEGDLIYINWNSRKLVFQVRAKEIFTPSVENLKTTENIFPRLQEPTLILQTCWPVGFDDQRLAVKAVLVN